MILRWKKVSLQLAKTFTISKSRRKETPAVFVELEHLGVFGYGEASLPPYLGEDQNSVEQFLSRINPELLPELECRESVHAYVDALAPGNTAAKAAFDIAVHDWVGKRFNLPLYRLLGLDPHQIPSTSYTISIDTVPNIVSQLNDKEQFSFFKVKLGRDNDIEIIKAVRSVTDKPLRLDCNGGWRDKEYAARMVEWLSTQNVECLEQPFGVSMVDETYWLKERSPIPLIADESVQRLSDVKSVQDLFSGINVKLMKCTGIYEALMMIHTAKALGLKVMLGCMTESSCAISAAAHLAPMADWVDLDGALLLADDPFDGVKVEKGRQILSERPGIGALPRVAI